MKEAIAQTFVHSIIQAIFVELSAGRRLRHYSAKLQKVSQWASGTGRTLCKFPSVSDIALPVVKLNLEQCYQAHKVWTLLSGRRLSDQRGLAALTTS